MKTTIKALVITITVTATALGFSLWQNHTNTVSYKLRDCKPANTNSSSFIGYDCPNERVYIPVSDRAEIGN